MALVKAQVLRVAKDFNTDKLIYVKILNLNTNKELIGRVLKRKFKFLTTLIEHAKTKEPMVLNITFSENGTTWVSPGNSYIQQLEKVIK